MSSSCIYTDGFRWEAKAYGLVYPGLTAELVEDAGGDMPRRVRVRIEAGLKAIQYLLSPLRAERSLCVEGLTRSLELLQPFLFGGVCQAGLFRDRYAVFSLLPVVRSIRSRTDSRCMFGNFVVTVRLKVFGSRETAIRNITYVHTANK